MEINRGSIRDVNWHPRKMPARPASIRANAAREEEPTLDPKTRAEIETRIIAHLPPERMAELFRQEGVSRNDHLSRSLTRRIKDFLQF